MKSRRVDGWINEKKTSLMSQNVDETEEYELEEKAPTTTATTTTTSTTTTAVKVDSSQVASECTAAAVCERPRDRLQSTDDRLLAAAATSRVNSATSWFNFNKLSIGNRKRSFNVPSGGDPAQNAFLNLDDNDLSRVSSALILSKDNSGQLFSLFMLV